MDYARSEWNGFERLDFTFEGRRAIVVLPRERDPQGRWLFKTEYFGAFPAFELAMLERGWAVAHVANVTRWCLPEDTDIKPLFCDFLHKELGLSAKCMPVGMSCGGMQAVYFAAKYPQYVAALYLDAPVLNLLSCPCGVGVSRDDPGHIRLYNEFVEKTGRTVSDLINDRNHPIDHVPSLIKHRIPAFLICGDADMVVPYVENGANLSAAYQSSDVPFELILKPGCDHHPHGLEDNAPLIAFAERFFA